MTTIKRAPAGIYETTINGTVYSVERQAAAFGEPACWNVYRYTNGYDRDSEYCDTFDTKTDAVCWLDMIAAR